MRRFFLLAVAMAPVFSAEPTFTHIHPAGLQRGHETEAKFAGKFEPWPCQVWADAAGIEVTAGEKAGTFRVKVAADVKLGPHLLRVFNPEGASAPVAMVVDDAPQTADTEPNDSFRSPQPIGTLPAEINGRHEKAGDVDSFAVSLKKGQTLIAAVEAHVLAAGFDAMLRLVDERGTILAFNHDDVTLDPFLTFSAPSDGRYIVQTMGHKYPASTDVRFAGGDDCVYRLHLTAGPFVRHTWPLEVPVGKSRIALSGWNLPNPQAEVDSGAPPAFPVKFSDIPQFMQGGETSPLPVPCGFSGRLSAGQPEAVVAFSVAKNVPLKARVSAREHGSRIDPWLAIRDPGGREVARNDDAGGSTAASVAWTPAVDGVFTALVGDVTHRTGDDCHFHLQVSTAQPTAEATTASHAVKVEAGKTEPVKVTVALANGFARKLRLVATDLPPGVTAPETEVPDKGGEVSVPLTAEATAAAAAQPFRIVLREADGGAESSVRHVMTTSSENNGVPQGYQKLLIESTDQLWLTVKAVPPPPSPKPADPPAKPPEPAKTTP